MVGTAEPQAAKPEGGDSHAAASRTEALSRKPAPPGAKSDSETTEEDDCDESSSGDGGEDEDEDEHEDENEGDDETWGGEPGSAVIADNAFGTPGSRYASPAPAATPRPAPLLPFSTPEGETAAGAAYRGAAASPAASPEPEPGSGSAGPPSAAPPESSAGASESPPESSEPPSSASASSDEEHEAAPDRTSAPLEALAFAVPRTTEPVFDVTEYYEDILRKDEGIAMPVAAVDSLAECVARTPHVATMQELLQIVDKATDDLKARSMNPVSLIAGCDLFIRFMTSQRPPEPAALFQAHRRSLIHRAREFVRGSKACVQRIAEAAAAFIEDGATIMVHGYSRPVTQALLYAAHEGKKRFKVMCTESRPFGLGVRTHDILKQNGIPVCIILDSAVAYAMAKCDAVFVGAEGVVVSGGLINYIGGYQMALAAKAHGKPLYALAESYKFLRLFPLDQYDLPTGFPLLQFSSVPDPGAAPEAPPTYPRRPMTDSPMPEPLRLTDSMVTNNPLLDYTTPDLISLLVSDLGVVTPPGVSDILLSIFGGE